MTAPLKISLTDDDLQARKPEWAAWLQTGVLHGDTAPNLRIPDVHDAQPFLAAHMLYGVCYIAHPLARDLATASGTELVDVITEATAPGRTTATAIGNDVWLRACETLRAWVELMETPAAEVALALDLESEILHDADWSITVIGVTLDASVELIGRVAAATGRTALDVVRDVLS